MSFQAIFKEMEANRKFWECEQEPGEWWDTINHVGLRYVALPALCCLL